MPTETSRPQARDGDEAPELAAIHRLVAALEHAQQTESVEGFVGLFRPDAVWVTGHGKRLTGLDEIAAFTRAVLPGAMKESTARYEIVHVTFVRPDVAVVNVRQQPVTLDGRPLDDRPQGSPVYVVAKESGRWRIAAGQNTIVVAD
jgi:uncharacterized protein (TIGR02246 family)